MPSLLLDLLESLKSTSYLVLVPSLIVVYFVGCAFYNLYVNPLKRFPGPKLWSISQIPFSLTWMSGSGHKKMFELHQKYGDIVRITPNQLSYGYPEAWNDIMGHRKRGQEENGKDPDFWRDQDKLTLVGSTRERHNRLRKILSNGFSAQAMVDQQPVFQQYADLLVTKLRAAAGASTAGSVEITRWYNWATFDMAGDLIFGEPFGCLEKGQYHPWVKLIFMHIKGISISTALIRFPFADTIIKLMTPKSVAKDIQAHHDFTAAQVGKRIAYENPRPDFMDSMIKAHGKGEVSMGEILANAHNLIVGGSETTATTLAGTTYLLAMHKPIQVKLYEELRAHFDTDDQIDLINVQKLDYMFAVIHEALRVYPAVPSAIPRKTPPEGSYIGGEFIPPNTILGIWQWPMFHNPKYFRDPEQFVPERWLGDKRYENDKREAMQAFSVGPRNCIGKNLAYAEMRLILAKMIWNFDIDLDPKSEGWMERNVVYLLWEKPELYIRLTPKSA